MERQNVLQALEVVYGSHGSGAGIREASDFIERWQDSEDAWSFSDQMLHDPDAPMGAQFGCAKILRTKVEKDLDQLPASAIPQLRDSLVQLLLKFCQGSPPVRTQLCLAIAALAAHLPAVEWGGVGPVRWLADGLGRLDSKIALPCMLELLTVLPQEAEGTKAAVRPQRRREFLQELVASVQGALEVLASCLNYPEDSAQSQVLDAFAAWLRLTTLGPDAAARAGADGAQLAASPLTDAALAGLSRGALFDSAVNAVCELIWCTTHSPGGHVGAPPESMLPAVHKIVPEAMKLRARFLVASRRAANPEDESIDVHGWDDDHETAKGMARLFAETGEAYSGIVVSGAGGAAGGELVEAMLEVAGHPDDTICAISFNFWHRLSVELCVPPPPPRDEAQQRANAEEAARRRAAFVPAFEQLVRLIQGRVKYPPEYEAWTRQERHEFKRARYAVADTLEDAANVIGGTRIMGILVGPLQGLAAAVQAGQAFDWVTAEAALYCIRSVYRVGTQSGPELLGELFGTVLPALPGHPRLQYTVCLTCQAYADWLASPDAARVAPGALMSSMRLVSECLGDKEACGAAGQAFKHLCDAGGAELQPQLPQMMALLQKVLCCGAVARLATEPAPFPISEVEVSQMLEGVSLLVGTLPQGQVTEGLASLLNPIMGMLHQLVSAGIAFRTPQHDVALALVERTTQVFRNVVNPTARAAALPTPPHVMQAAAQALQSAWPLLLTAFEALGADVDSVEKLCVCLRNGVKAAGAFCAPLVPALLQELPRKFHDQRHACYLYVASELVKTFGNQPGEAEHLRGLVHGLLGEAVAQLASPQDFYQHPDVADDAFLLASRTATYFSPALCGPASGDLMERLVWTAVRGLHVLHQDAFLSVQAFLVKALDPAWVTVAPAMDGLLQEVGPQLALAVLAGVCGALPAARVHELSEVLLALLRVQGGRAAGWVGQCVGVVPEVVMTAGDKERFLEACGAAVRSASSSTRETMQQLREYLADACADVADLCRRNRRMQDAALMALGAMQQGAPGR
ncbi:unnamed protein product [Pedinophyceae sp. YPF-701]|nr:unnamed protein product [Pedinophyceae sp. YPF-701]